MLQTNKVFITTFAMIAMGYLLKRFNYVSEKDGKTLSKFLMHSTFPALLFLSMSRVQLDMSLLILPFIAIITGTIMLVIAWYVLRSYPNNQRGVLMMGVGAFNTGLFGFPIFESLFGREGLSYAVMFDIGVTPMCFAVLYPLSAYFSDNHKDGLDKKVIIKKILSSPPIIVVTLGLLVNILGINIPSICVDFLEILAKGNKPIVLLLMGIYLIFDLKKKQRLSIYKVLTIRYLVGILSAFVLYFIIPSQYAILKMVLMLCMVLPIGMTILPFSDEMNLDTRLAGTLLNVSLVVSFVLMWGLMLLI